MSFETYILILRHPVSILVRPHMDHWVIVLHSLILFLPLWLSTSKFSYMTQRPPWPLSSFVSLALIIFFSILSSWPICHTYTSSSLKTEFQFQMSHFDCHSLFCQSIPSRTPLMQLIISPRPPTHWPYNSTLFIITPCLNMSYYPACFSWFCPIITSQMNVFNSLFPFPLKQSFLVKPKLWLNPPICGMH